MGSAIGDAKSAFSRKEFSIKNNYYFWLCICSITGLIVLLHRCRLGVDLTDDAWYTADPYWVAKGAIPYVNNWTQASGFTLPLYLAHYCFLNITGENEGIFIFSRVLFCLWKTIVTAFSFFALKRADISVSPLLSMPIIIFNPAMLYAINYNSIGWSYSLLIMAIMAKALTAHEESPHRHNLIIGVAGGFLMGRCVIGTPATLIVCFMIIMILLFRRNISSLSGFILGGMFCAIAVMLFCIVRGGIRETVIGFQYYFKDLTYLGAVDSIKSSFYDSMIYLIRYISPAVAVLSVVILLRLIINNTEYYNGVILTICCVLLLFSLRYFLQYSYNAPGVGNLTKFGWFIPLVCVCFICEDSVKKKLAFGASLALIYFSVFVFQGMTVLYGIENRAYWNYSSFIFGIFSVYTCAANYGKIKGKHCTLTLVAVCLAISVLSVRGAYDYVYRDVDVGYLDTKVTSGPWKGCYTTKERAETVPLLEDFIKSRTEQSDHVLCWGHWSSFMNLLYNGYICAPSPLDTGQKNGFDFWHMYQVVPNKVFVNIDELDSRHFLTDKNNIWSFINEFYEETDSIEYVSYLGTENKFSIIEYEISDYEAALKYADEMASVVFDFD